MYIFFISFLAVAFATDIKFSLNHVQGEEEFRSKLRVNSMISITHERKVKYKAKIPDGHKQVSVQECLSGCCQNWGVYYWASNNERCRSFSIQLVCSKHKRITRCFMEPQLEDVGLSKSIELIYKRKIGANTLTTKLEARHPFVPELRLREAKSDCLSTEPDVANDCFDDSYCEDEQE